MKAPLLDSENFRKGFLIDEELMGGVSEEADAPGTFLAYVMRHTTGEYLGAQRFGSLEGALGAINSVERDWRFEKTSGCGGCKNNVDGACAIGGCGGKCACSGCD